MVERESVELSLHRTCTSETTHDRENPRSLSDVREADRELLGHPSEKGRVNAVGVFGVSTNLRTRRKRQVPHALVRPVRRSQNEDPRLFTRGKTIPEPVKSKQRVRTSQRRARVKPSTRPTHVKNSALMVEVTSWLSWPRFRRSESISSMKIL